MSPDLISARTRLAVHRRALEKSLAPLTLEQSDAIGFQGPVLPLGCIEEPRNCTSSLLAPRGLFRVCISMVLVCTSPCQSPRGKRQVCTIKLLVCTSLLAPYTSPPYLCTYPLRVLEYASQVCTVIQFLCTFWRKIREPPAWFCTWLPRRYTAMILRRGGDPYRKEGPKEIRPPGRIKERWPRFGLRSFSWPCSSGAVRGWCLRRISLLPR